MYNKNLFTDNELTNFINDMTFMVNTKDKEIIEKIEPDFEFIYNDDFQSYVIYSKPWVFMGRKSNINNYFEFYIKANNNDNIVDALKVLVKDINPTIFSYTYEDKKKPEINIMNVSQKYIENAKTIFDNVFMKLETYVSLCNEKNSKLNKLKEKETEDENNKLLEEIVGF